jgi:sugar O-acyltransferase (sialic acid O-acetyltransferase NeuD family)
MTNRLVVVGAGGFGREALDVIDAVNRAGDAVKFDVIGIVDDKPSPDNLKRLSDRGVAYLGSVGDWLATGDDADYLIAVGSPAARKPLADRFDSAALRPATAIHPCAVIGSMASVGAGSIVCSGVQVSTNVRLGRHVHLNSSATIGHDSILGDFTSVNPAATVSGECILGYQTLVGAGAVILQGRRVGARCVVGAASCVTHDVEDDAVVKGVPAR